MSEHLTWPFKNPLEAYEAARALTETFGVEASMADNPALYREQIRPLNPRYRDSRGDSRNISRQQLQDRAHPVTNELYANAVMGVCERLGLLETTHPFDEFAECCVDAIVVTGGVYSALKQRTAFAMTDKERTPIYIIGGSRIADQNEIDALEEDGLRRDTHVQESDLARAVVSSYYDSDRHIYVFEPRHTRPDNLIALREFAITHPRIQAIAAVTTALYVPFTSYDGEVVRQEYGTEIQVYAGESTPEAVAKRTLNIYQSEMVKTLDSAARLQEELLRRK